MSKARALPGIGVDLGDWALPIRISFMRGSMRRGEWFFTVHIGPVTFLWAETKP